MLTTFIVTVLFSYSAGKRLILVHDKGVKINDVVRSDAYTKLLVRDFENRIGISTVRVLQLTSTLSQVADIESDIFLYVVYANHISPLIYKTAEMKNYPINMWILFTSSLTCQKRSTAYPKIVAVADMETFLKETRKSDTGTRMKLPTCTGIGRLEKTHLKAGTYDLPPFTNHEIMGNNTSWTGIEIDLFKTIIQSLNMTYNMTQAPENNFIMNNPKRNLVDMMREKEVDIAVSGLVYNSDRARLFDLIWPSYFGNWIIVLPPPAVEYDIFSNVKPFQASVWGAIIFCLVLLSLIMWILAKQLQMENEFSLPLLYNLSLMAGQGGFNPKNLQGRFLLAGWNLGAVVIVFGYTSIMISFITAPVADFPVKKFEDLVTKDALKPVSNRNLYLTAHFLQAKSGYQKQLGDMLRKCGSCQVSTDDEAIDKVLGGQYGFLTGQPIAETLLTRDFKATGKCRLALWYPEDPLLVSTGWYISKDLKEITEIIKLKIMTTHESGLSRYVYRQHLPAIPCYIMANLIPKYEEKPLTTLQLQTAFALLGIGWLASSIIFVYELVRRQKTKISIVKKSYPQPY